MNNNLLYIDLLMRAKTTMRMTGVITRVGEPSQYICDNVQEAAMTVPLSIGLSRADYEEAANELEAEISKRIDHYLGVDNWLVEQGYVAVNDRSEETFRQIQLYRQRWIDALIAEFSAS